MLKMIFRSALASAAMMLATGASAQVWTPPLPGGTGVTFQWETNNGTSWTAYGDATNPMWGLSDPTFVMVPGPAGSNPGLKVDNVPSQVWNKTFWVYADFTGMNLTAQQWTDLSAVLQDVHFNLDLPLSSNYTKLADPMFLTDRRFVYWSYYIQPQPDWETVVFNLPLLNNIAAAHNSTWGDLLNTPDFPAFPAGLVAGVASYCPEPATIGLLGVVGIVGLVAARRRLKLRKTT